MVSSYIPDPHDTGFDVSPAGAHTEGQRANTKRFSDVTKGMYHWVKKRLPSPGAQNYAFENLGLVEFAYVGRATHQRHMFSVLQPPQLYINGQAIPTTGLGGLSSGQAIMQPLLDPYNGTYAGQ